MREPTRTLKVIAGALHPIVYIFTAYEKLFEREAAVEVGKEMVRGPRMPDARVHLTALTSESRDETVKDNEPTSEVHYEIEVGEGVERGYKDFRASRGK
jgi:hypothetical protein